MPIGISAMLRSGVLNSLRVAAIMYVGAIVIACIRLGTISNFFAVARYALPWLYWTFAALFLAFVLYAVALLCLAKFRLKGTGQTLMQFMSLPLEERHALMKSLRRGPYRDA
jgi:hypothetical protein